MITPQSGRGWGICWTVAARLQISGVVLSLGEVKADTQTGQASPQEETSFCVAPTTASTAEPQFGVHFQDGCFRLDRFLFLFRNGQYVCVAHANERVGDRRPSLTKPLCHLCADKKVDLRGFFAPTCLGCRLFSNFLVVALLICVLKLRRQLE